MPTMEENTQILKKNIGKKVALEKPVGWKKKKIVVLKIQFLRLPQLTMLIHKNFIICGLSKALGKDKERKRNTGHKILQLLRKIFKKHKRYNFVISSDLMSRRNKGSENIWAKKIVALALCWSHYFWIPVIFLLIRGMRIKKYLIIVNFLV